VDLEGTNTRGGSVGQPFHPVQLFVMQPFDISHVNIGWTVGAGIEGKLPTPGWTCKIEGLYIDLGSFDATSPSVCFSTRAPCAGEASLTLGPLAARMHFAQPMVRAGLNYQFR